MDNMKTSWMYSESCNRMHKAINDFYENIHTKRGEPKHSIEQVMMLTAEMRSFFSIELDLIKEICREYEEHGGQ